MSKLNTVLNWCFAVLCKSLDDEHRIAALTFKKNGKAAFKAPFSRVQGLAMHSKRFKIQKIQLQQSNRRFDFNLHF